MVSNSRRLLLLALPVLMLLPGLPSAVAQEERPTIRVSGEGVVAAPSDMALVSLGVVTEAVRAADALTANSKAMTAVLESVKSAGIEARDVQTSQIALRPQYSMPQRGAPEGRKVIGYEAANEVTIRVRALDKLGGLLDSLVTSGANQLRNVSLTIAEPEPLRDKARTAAMKDAMRRAELLADAAGVRIVRLFLVAEQFAEPPRPMAARMQADMIAAAPVPVEAGEQEIRVRVTAEFEIAPK